MKLFAQRTLLAAAYAWKRERISTLEARIELQWKMLASLHAELAEVQALHGEKLALRFGCETLEELAQTMHGQRTWLEEMKALWIWPKHPEKPERRAA